MVAEMKKFHACTEKIKKVYEDELEVYKQRQKKQPNEDFISIADASDVIEKLCSDIKASSEVNSKEQDDERIKELRRIYTGYVNIRSSMKRIEDEEMRIERFEWRAIRRGWINKGVSTLLFGFLIMIVYGLAHWWGIPMPLMKIPGG